MNIVCLGASGLLGSFISALYPEVIPQTHENCDITSSDSIKKMFDTYQPDIIINCAGDVSRDNSNITRLFTINSFGPKLLSHYCKHDCQIIHISTNCVFSGTKPNRNEGDIPDPDTLYGISKLTGEITTFPHITVRSSFVGWPDGRRRGLLAWLYAQKKHVYGYERVLWNGLTVSELAHQIMRVIKEKDYIPLECEQERIIHIYGPTISKYELLKTTSRVLEWNKLVIPTQEPEEDHTLSSLFHFKSEKSFEQQVQEMKEVGGCVWTLYRSLLESRLDLIKVTNSG